MVRIFPFLSSAKLLGLECFLLKKFFRLLCFLLPPVGIFCLFFFRLGGSPVALGPVVFPKQGPLIPGSKTFVEDRNISLKNT